MAQDNKVVSFSGQKPPQRFSLSPAMIRLRDASGQSLKSVLASFLDRADDALFELADRAGSNVDQTAYFDAMRELRLRRKATVVSVLQYVSQAFNDIGRFQPRASTGSLDEVDQDSLSLLDHSQVEQQLAIDSLISKLRTRYAEPIQLLTLRVNHLVPNVQLTDSQMPLSPEVICGGVAVVCADLDIDIRAKLVVLKLFDRLLADTLGDFYKEANHTLITEGVLPDMKRPPAAQTRARTGSGMGSRAVPPSTSASARATETGDENRASGPQPTFSELSALLHPDGNVSQPSLAGEDRGEGYIDTGLLMARLSEMQSVAGQWNAEQMTTLHDQLQSVLINANGKSFNVAQVDNDVINLVAMLFDFILEDRHLHPVMKTLIGRLQIPVLKVALSDQNFFNRGGHPVRKLLNELALSAIGWSEKRAGQRDPLLEKIESVVDRVLNEFTDNVGLFDELLQDFRHFMDLDQRRRDLVEQRLRDAEEGRARQERALEAAESLVRDQLQGRDVPEPVAGILHEAWSRYLQWVVLREGEDSERWATACSLTERLVWSVDPRPVSESTRSDLLRAIPSVVDELRKALQEISWDPFATDSAIRDLELAHVDVFQKLVTSSARSAPQSGVPEATMSGNPDSEAEPDDERGVEIVADAQKVPATSTGAVPEVTAPVDTAIDMPVEEVAQEWLSRADALRVGSWIELTKDDTRIRCKLAAFIKATGKYIFVNRSGAKVAEYYRNELGSSMAKGEMTMLDDGLIFDRALESIIDNLRSSRKD
jgi:hypothetical protein